MLIDNLIESIKKKQNPGIVGIDPDWEKLPVCYYTVSNEKTECILQWGKDVIDSICDIVPVVKPQSAFYEVYGSKGIEALEATISYAHEKGLIVINDCKRNDIGNTAKAYAKALLNPDNCENADFITVSPYLGRESILPFFETAIQNDRGVFLVVKPSNPGSGEISEAVTLSGKMVYEELAEYISTNSTSTIGLSGYSALGAVVGATYPEIATKLRVFMPHNLFLVPGYGAQGGNAASVIPCFNSDGLGALVSSSRGVLYSYGANIFYEGSRSMYKEIVRNSALKMRSEIYSTLKENCKNMKY